MTPAQWKRVEELYHAARTRPPAERQAFLADGCGDDEAVRREVESLLNEQVSDDGFLDAPPVEGAARLIAGVAPADMTGRSLGGYELQRLLGAGGMGEVYQARDVKLGRDVAIKILPEVFTRNANRLARFEREARMLAALNHPNICAIYGLEEANGIRFLILELVGGQTLADRLANPSRGHSRDPGLQVSDALAFARQIAEALEFAHDKGIIHRDLKPANIKITTDGVVKVLDFGLAKAVAGDGSNPDVTAVPSDATGEPGGGAVLGTAAYMSPEQARGRSVDRRADIWAFGAVLFEMLTGRRPFAGDSTSETLACVLKTEPEWNALPQRVPPDLRGLLARCLTKDPKRRLQSIGEARVQIEDLLTGVPGRTTLLASGKTAPRRWAVALGGGVVALGLFVAASPWFNPDGESSAIDRLLARATVMQITEFEGGNLDAAISPDGQFVLFLSDHDGPFHVWLKRLGAGSAKNLTPGQPDQRNPGPTRHAGFNGDASEVWINGSFSKKTRLRLVPLMGGSAKPFLNDHAINVTWSPDATRLVYFTSGEDVGDSIYVADGAGDAELLYQGAKGDHNHFPAWSPDGRWIYFVCAAQSLSEFGICRVPSSGRTDQPTRLTESTNDVRYLTPMDARTILFVAPGQDRSGPWLWALDVERKTAHRVTSGLDLERYLSIAATADGHRLVVTVARPTSSSLWSMPILNRAAEDGDVTPYAAEISRPSAPRFRGGSLFYLAPSGPGDGLWRIQDGGPPSEIWKGVDGVLLESPSVSPSGDRVALVVRRQAKLHIVLVDADGANHNYLKGPIDVRGASAWSSDGDWIVTGGVDEKGPGLFKIRVADGTSTRLFAGQAFNPVWSPDGRVIVFEGQQAAAAPLLAVRPDGSPVANFPTILVAGGGGGRARFLADSSLIYMKSSTGTQDFFQMDLATFRTRQIAHVVNAASVNTFDITADGKHIVFDRVREQSDIRLIDLPKE